MGNVVVLSVRRCSPRLKVRRPFHAVMLGLDRSGKTTLLYRSKLKEYVDAVPTTAFNVETVRSSKQVKFKIWDVSGRDQNRPLWKAYARNTDAIIFVVDSVDEARIDEAKEELFNVVNSAQINGAPILVFANKQDMANASPPIELINKLSLHNLDSKHLWFLQPSSAILGDGIQEGLQVLTDMILQWKADVKTVKKGYGQKRSLTVSRTNSVNNFL